MRVAFCCSEVFPFAKTGGLGDVGASLPKALTKAGCQVKVFMPLYKNIEPERTYDDFGVTKQAGVEVYFIKHDEYFRRDHFYTTSCGNDYPDNLERFSFFSKQVLSLLKKIDFSPDIIHSNDWHTALTGVYLKTTYKNDSFFKKTKCVFTIHNLAFQGIFDTVKGSLLGIGREF